MACATSKASDQPAHMASMSVKLLPEHHLEFLNVNGRCRGSSESTHVKMPHCWKSHATAQISNGSILRFDSEIKCIIEPRHGISNNLAF